MPNTQSVGSSILPVSLAAYQAVTAWINSLFGLSMPNWSTFNLRSFEHFAFPVEQSSNCLLCKWKPVDRITRPLIIPKKLHKLPHDCVTDINVTWFLIFT